MYQLCIDYKTTLDSLVLVSFLFCKVHKLATTHKEEGNKIEYTVSSRKQPGSSIEPESTYLSKLRSFKSF